jgi:magnesium transporter
VITVRHIDAALVRSVSVEDGLALASTGDGVTWFDLVGDDAEIRDLLGDLGVDEFLAEDMLQTATHPKAEARADHMLLVVNGLDLDADADRFQLSTMELDALLGRTWLVTHADEELEVTQTAAHLLGRDASLAPTAAELLHLLLDAMVDEYEPFIDGFIPDRVDAVEDALFEGRTDPEIRQEIHLRRRDVQRLQRAAAPQAEAVRRAAALCGALAPEQQHLFSDIADRLTRVAAQTEALRAQLDTAFAQYQTIVSNTQNEIMKVLTMVSATLLPITVVAGIYGMNFDFMPELEERWGYPVVMMINLIIVIGSLSFFRWKGWIGRHGGRKQPGSGSLDLGFGRILRTPAMGARAVTRTAGRLVRFRRRP